MKVKIITSLAILLCSSAFSHPGKDNPNDSLRTLLELSTEAMYSYEYNEAIDFSLRLIEIANGKKDYYHLYHGYNNLGITYDKLYDTTRAKNSYEEALKYAQLVQNDTLIWWAYNNLGNMFTSNKETIEKGFEYYDKAIEAASSINDPDSKATPLVNKAWTYLFLKEYDKAFPYMKQVEDIIGKTDDAYAQSQLASLFGTYYSGKNNLTKSKEYFEKAIKFAEKDSLYFEAVQAYNGYAEVLFKNREFEAAYKALDKYIEYDAELYEKEKLEQMEAAQARFDTNHYRKKLELAKKEQQFKDVVIEKSRQISWILSISLIITILFIILLYKNNRTRKSLILALKNKNKEILSAKEEAERLSSLKTRFFSTVSHELRTPLYGVVGLTSLLLEENKNKKKEEDLKSLKFSADYLLALINDVLQMNKMESNLVQLEENTFNIKQLFQGMVKTFETTKNNKNIKIELDVDPTIPYLVGDSMRLSQIMMNLAGNAIKFTEKGKVWMKAENLSCAEGRCKVRFEVGDTGIGIPQNKQEEIFEEFSQLNIQNLSYQGTGLGLAIVKKLLKLFHSEIQVRSVEGEGSIFSFEIAFEQGAEAESIRHLSNADAPEAIENDMRRVLIVDDNRINQVVTQRILAKKGFQCLLAASGEEALEMIGSQQLDLVLMDVNMPGMNGMQTTMKIREVNPELPVIALTAVEVGELQEEIFQAGMNDIIHKPYNIPQFFTTIFRNLLQPVA